MSSDFLKQKTTLRYPTDFLIGDLLVRAGVVTAKQLDEAVRLAGNKHVHVGQMLVMARYLSQRNLQAAVDAQSAVRDRTIDMNAAVKALKQACRTSVTFAEACQSQDLHSGGDNPTNRLGEILLEAGLINRDQFHKAMQRSLATGLPLGRILVLNNALGEPLLLTVLELQVRVRDEIMTRDEAIDQLKSICEKSGESLSAEEAAQIQQSLRPPRRKGIRLGELLVLAGLLQEADVMNALELGLSNNMQIGQVIVNQGFISTEILDAALRLQELCDSDQMSDEQAAETLHRVHETGLSLDDAVNQIGLGLTEAGVKELSYQSLLTLARVVSEEDIHAAFELIMQTPEYTAQLLAITGHIQPVTAEATVRCHWLINNGYLNQDDALVALDFCLQKQAESEITFDDALEELGWSLGEGTQTEGESGLAEEDAPVAEESALAFEESLEVESLRALPEEEAPEELEAAEPELAEIQAEEEPTEDFQSEEVSLEAPQEIESLQDESLEEALLEEAIEEILEESLEEVLSEEPVAEEETLLEEPVAEETTLEEEPESIELESPLEEEEPQAAPQLLEADEEPILFEESLTLLESEEAPEIEEEARPTSSLQSLLSSRRDVGSETVDSLPAIGEQHGYLSESLSEPFENPDSASLLRAEEMEESNGNGLHLDPVSEEEEESVVSLEDESPSTDFSNFEFEPSQELMELDENFAVLDDSDAIQLVDSTDEIEDQIEIEEHEAVAEVEAPSEDFAPEPAPERGRGLGSLFAASEKPAPESPAVNAFSGLSDHHADEPNTAKRGNGTPPNGGAKDSYEKQATTGNGKAAAAAAANKAGVGKGMSLKSLLDSYNTDSPEAETPTESEDEAPAPVAAQPKTVPVAAAASAKKKEELVLSEKDQIILAAASSLTATPEEIKAAALILAGVKAPAAPTSPLAASSTAKASALAQTPVAPPAPAAVPSAVPAPAKAPAAPAAPAAKAPMRTAGQLLSGAAVASPPAAPAQPAAPQKPAVAASAHPAPKPTEADAAPKAKPQPAAKPSADAEGGPEELNSVLGEAFVRLAESYYEQGNYPEAEKLYSRILTLREKELGMKNPLLLNDLNNLAGVLCVQGKFSDAEVFVQRSVNIVESHEPDNMLKLADGLNTLAGIYYQQDKYDQCEPLLERALRLRQRALGEDHPDIADNLRDYAKFLKKVNRPEEAEKMYAQAKAVLAKAMKNAAR